MKKKRQFSCGILALCLIVFSLLCFAQPPAVPQTIRVGCIDLENFIEQKDNGMIKGYGAAYLDEIAKYTGWRYEYVSGTWGQCLEWLKEGKIDLLLPAEYSEERSREYRFSKYSCCVDYAALYTSQENETLFYQDYASFDGIRVGMIRQNHLNEIFFRFAAEHQFQPIPFYYDSLTEMTAALTQGAVDAIVNGSLSTAPQQKLLAKFDFMPAYFIAAKAQAALMDELDHAMYQILLDNPYFTAMLNEQFYQNSTLHMKGFTREETAYIQSSEPLTVVCDANNYPLEWYNADSEAYEGVYPDIWAEVAKQSGLRFQVIRTDSLEASWKFIRDGKADLISGIYGNPLIGREYHITYTAPHILENNTLIGNRNVDFNGKAPLRAAVPRSLIGTQYYLQEYYPHWIVRPYDTLDECLRAVNAHEADITFLNSAAVQISSLLDHYPNLGIITTESIAIPVSIGIADRHSPLLRSILDKAILRVSKTEIQKSILNNTFVMPHKITFHYLTHNYLPEILGLALLIIVSLSIGILFLYRERVKTKQNFLLALSNASLEKSVMLARHINQARDLYDGLYDTALCGIIQYELDDATQQITLLHANKGACVMLEIHETDGSYHFSEAASDIIRKARQDAALLCQAEDKHPFEEEVTRASGERIWVSGTSELLLARQGKKIIQSTFMDLTSRKHFEEQLQYHSETDALTGLYNKGTSEKLCQAYLLQDSSQQQTAALFVMDLDNFKLANDSYGHQYGDEVLRRFGALLRDIFRKDDIIGRVGGDEFIVLMKDTADQAVIEGKAQEICRQITQIADAQHTPMACSIGIAMQKMEETSYNDLFSRADHALYKIKLSGKNSWYLHR